jgi:hypothetical protein
VKTYIEEFLTTFSGFHQTVFSFLTAHSLRQLFPQLTATTIFFTTTAQPNTIHIHLPVLSTQKEEDMMDLNMEPPEEEIINEIDLNMEPVSGNNVAGKYLSLFFCSYFYWMSTRMHSGRCIKPGANSRS